jgi:ribosomal protein S18 acetylase RimI-like enzyme
VQISWYDASLRDGMVELVRAVAELGGAVGWLEVPSEDEVHKWLASVPPARMAVATDGSTVLASGIWCANGPGVLERMGRISKVMTHPLARRTGAARAVMQQLIADARAEGIEVLTLDCRGNNHGAQRMYASLGFRVTGRHPDALAIGDERWDQVLMHLDLRQGPDGLVRHGSRREGAGLT